MKGKENSTDGRRYINNMRENTFYLPKKAQLGDMPQQESNKQMEGDEDNIPKSFKNVKEIDILSKRDNTTTRTSLSDDTRNNVIKKEIGIGERKQEEGKVQKQSSNKNINQVLIKIKKSGSRVRLSGVFKAITENDIVESKQEDKVLKQKIDKKKEKSENNAPRPFEELQKIVSSFRDRAEAEALVKNWASVKDDAENTKAKAEAEKAEMEAREKLKAIAKDSANESNDFKTLRRMEKYGLYKHLEQNEITQYAQDLLTKGKALPSILKKEQQDFKVKLKEERKNSGGRSRGHDSSSERSMDRLSDSE